jgi:hypothetical protein
MNLRHPRAGALRRAGAHHPASSQERSAARPRGAAREPAVAGGVDRPADQVVGVLGTEPGQSFWP